MCQVRRSTAEVRSRAAYARHVFRTILIRDGGEPDGRDALRLARYLASSESRFVLTSADSPDALGEAASDEQADLIVVPTGRTAKRLLHGLEVPVALAPAGFAAGPEDRLRVIGVGFDAGDESRRALGLAEQLTLEHGATMRVYSVIPPRAYATSRIEPTPAEYRARVKESLAEHLREEVEQLDGRARAAASVVRGEPVAALAKVSAEGLDLLVLGSRRQGPVSRLMLGSVSSDLVDRAECALLVVPLPVPDSRQVGDEPAHSRVPA